VAEFSSILPSSRIRVQYFLDLFSISVQFVFSFNSYNFVSSKFVLVTYYVFIVSKIILTLYKYSRTYFLSCIILEHSLAILKEAVVKDSFCFKLPIRLETVSKGRFHMVALDSAWRPHTCKQLRRIPAASSSLVTAFVAFVCFVSCGPDWTRAIIRIAC